MKPKELGHVHLKVNNLNRAEAFYTKILGLKVTQKVNNEFVFLSLGKHHHDIALMNIGNAPHPDEWMTGLYHFALELKNKAEFKAFYKKLKANKVEVSPVNHGISLAMYFNDPDNNTIELYVDTRKKIKQWNGNQALTEKDINRFQ